MTALLELRQVDAYYGKIQALRGIDIQIEQGQIITLLGSNGAGKSTTLKSISGLMGGLRGSIKFEGQDLTKLSAHEIVRRGIVHVPEGRRIFGGLTVIENLELGSFTQRKNQKFVHDTMEHVLTIFPRLRERQKQRAGTLSGGEQQMLAIGRALMSNPKLLMLDEPSMGLAPIIVKEIMKIIERINQDGITILLVEQNAKMALRLAHFGYVLETGSITLAGSADELRDDPNVMRAYLSQG